MAATGTLVITFTGTNTALSGNSQVNSYLELTGFADKPLSFLGGGGLVISIAAGATATITPPSGGWTGNIDVAIAVEYIAAVPDSTLTLDATALILRRAFVGVMDTSMTITNNTASAATYQIQFWKEA